MNGLSNLENGTAYFISRRSWMCTPLSSDWWYKTNLWLEESCNSCMYRAVAIRFGVVSLAVHSQERYTLGGGGGGGGHALPEK